MSFHVPVMVDEVVHGLVVNPAGTYLDATAGGGGHSQAILANLGPAGRLLSVDRDEEAVAVCRTRLADDRVGVRRGRFSELGGLLEEERISALDGVLFDLGVSSHQIDEARRGFSYRHAGPLDMRMDSHNTLSANELIEGTSEEELTDVIRRFGEEFRAKIIAGSIKRHHERGLMRNTHDLRIAVEATGPRHPAKTLSRVFQALRIAVNNELEQLELGLDTSIERLKQSGRLAVISYHSLEDRLVKSKFAPLIHGCICPPGIPVCACGRKPTFVAAVRRQRSGAEEVEANRRARSANLRIFEQL